MSIYFEFSSWNFLVNLYFSNPLSSNGLISVSIPPQEWLSFSSINQLGDKITFPWHLSVCLFLHKLNYLSFCNWDFKFVTIWDLSWNRITQPYHPFNHLVNGWFTIWSSSFVNYLLSTNLYSCSWFTNSIARI